jgi:hypothetical protein
VATQSIHQIDVNDQNFKAFHALFQKYQSQLAQMPSQWAAVGAAANSANNIASRGFESVINALAVQTAILQRAMEAQRKVSDYTDRTVSGWRRIADDVGRATASFLKWGSVSTAISGLIGAGGLYGIDRLAEGVSSTRRTAGGLGISYGQQQAFGLNLGRFVDPGQLLGASRNAIYDVTNPAYIGLRNAGITQQDISGGNAATVSAKFIQNLPQLFAGTPRELYGSKAQALGLTNLTDLGSIIRILEAPKGERESQIRAFQNDAKNFELQKEVTLKWQDLNTQLGRASLGIEKVFVNGLSGLTDPISKLSAATEHVVAAFLDGAQKWIGPLGDELEKFAKFLGTDDFEKDLKNFTTGVGEAGKVAWDIAGTIGEAAKWIAKFIPEEDKTPASDIGDSPREAGSDVGKIIGAGLGAAAGFVVGGFPGAAVGAAGGAALGGRTGGNIADSVSGFFGSYGNITYGPDGNPNSFGQVKGPKNMLDLVRGLEGSGDNTVSPAGAVGRYQVLPSTAKGYGYDPSKLTDPEYGRKVATSVLADLVKQYHGNLDEVLVGYNASSRVRKRFVESGDNPNVLPAETRRYLERAHAALGFQRAQVEVMDLTGGAVAINVSQLR